jgi:hypothetical protein
MSEELDRLSANTNETVVDEDDEVEAHARYSGNTNESVDEDDEVEAHMRGLDPTS